MKSFYPMWKTKLVVDRYFDSTDKPTMTGLARALGVSRKELVNYNGASAVLNDGKMRIEEYLESKLGGSGERGAMFGLKMNFGWRDDGKGVDPVAAAVVAPPRSVREMSHEELMAIIDGTA